MILFEFILCLLLRLTVTQQMKMIDWEGSDYPFMATVYRWDSKKLAKIENHDHFCTGALVADDQVITSQLCAYNLMYAKSNMGFSNSSSSLEVHHLVNCRSRAMFIRRNVKNVSRNEKIALLWLAPVSWELGCRVPKVKIELSQFVSRKVKLLSTMGEEKLLITNGSIESLEFMQMYYGPQQYSVVLEDGAPVPKKNYTSLIIVDIESKNFLGIVFDSSPLKSVYKAAYFYPELQRWVRYYIGPGRIGSWVDAIEIATNVTDSSITYSPTLNVTKPAAFKFSLDEVDWKAHKYIVQICNKRTTKICTAALVENNTLVTSPKCATQSAPNDTLVVKHFAQNRNTTEWELVTRGVTKWRTVKRAKGLMHHNNSHYIFMDLSAFAFQSEYDMEILKRPVESDNENSNKQYRYVRLVSLDWHFSSAGPTCAVNLNGTMPKVAQLDTLASLNLNYPNETVYDCHIFESSVKNISDRSTNVMYDYAFQTRQTMKFDSNYSSTHDGLYNLYRYNFGWYENTKCDYSLLFNESALLLDYYDESTKNLDKALLGLGFVEPCAQPGNTFCRTEMNKSINVLTVAKFEP